VQGQQQQQQQWDQAPQWDQQQHWQGSRGRQGQHYTQEALSAMYARAAEQQPDLGSMSVAELQNFIQKVRRCKALPGWPGVGFWVS
jgi:hypothetical protein